MKNIIIRKAMKEHNLKQWQVADLLGISEQTLCRKLRYELSEEEQEKILSVIESEEKKNA